jgi:hypothetical protein
MRLIRNWYPFLEGAGLTAGDLGPGLAYGTLTANVTWCPYYFPPGIFYGYKGVTLPLAASNIHSAAALGFNPDAGSIEMLVKPTWNFDDGIEHFLLDCYGGNNKRMYLEKDSDGLTKLATGGTSRGSFSFALVANTIYHIVLNWGTNALYINKVLVHTFTAGGLGLGSTNLYIGGNWSGTGVSFSGNIYYFIVRDIALTLAEITTFYNFFVNQYL